MYYTHLNDAIHAKEQLSGIEIDYRRIRVDYSITQRPHSPTPGVYKGKRYDDRVRSENSSSSQKYREDDRRHRRRTPSVSPRPSRTGHRHRSVSRSS